MNIKVSEVKGKLICNKDNHNEPISMVVIDDSIPMQERLLCVKCIQSTKGNIQMLELDQVLKSQNEQQRQKDYLILKKFQQKMKQYQAKIIKDFETTQQIIQQWINAYDIKDDDNSLKKVIKGLELLNEKSPIQDNEQIAEINQSYYQKLDSIMKKVINLNEFYKTYDLLKQLHKSEGKKKIRQQHEQDPLQNIYEIQYINDNFSDGWHHAMAFNITGSIMVSGSFKDIKVWQFEQGKLTEKISLSEHTDKINCLLFSKKLNWFFSGGSDHKIFGWKEQENGEWLSSQVRYHCNSVLFILLNRNEDQLIACGAGASIQVWKVNGESNNLEIYYDLEGKHTDWIYSLSMNESEDYLVSCSKDNKIILWHKDKQDRWKYQHEIYNNDCGYKIRFITDRQIIWQQQGKGITHVFECCGGEIIRKPNLNLFLNSETGDSSSFQTIFNKRKQIIIQSHNKFIYFLKRQENGSLQLIQDPMDCTYHCGYGTLTDDGEYLALENQFRSGFKIYKIKYMQ